MLLKFMKYDLFFLHKSGLNIFTRDISPGLLGFLWLLFSRVQIPLDKNNFSRNFSKFSILTFFFLENVSECG